jgi:hypothetical protein
MELAYFRPDPSRWTVPLSKVKMYKVQFLHVCHTLKACVLGFDGTLVNYVSNSRGILAHYLSLFGAAGYCNFSLKVLSNEMDPAEIRFIL